MTPLLMGFFLNAQAAENHQSEIIQQFTQSSFADYLGNSAQSDFQKIG